MANGGAGFGDYGAAIPPLATANFLSSAASSVAQEMTGEAATRRATERAQYEMAQISLDRMRSGVGGVGGNQNPLQVANPTKMIVSGPSRPVSPRLRSGKTVHETPIPPDDTPYTDRVSPVDKGRGFEADPVISVPGVMEMQNDWTGPKPIYLPGSDGEVMGFDEVLTTAVIGGPQYVYNNVIVPKLEQLKPKSERLWGLDDEPSEEFEQWYQSVPKDKYGRSKIGYK
jgi:hypothetical protein